MSKVEDDTASRLKRHEAQCSIFCSPHREEFEESFVNWSSPTDWHNLYSFSRYSVYRRSHQCGLFERRRENLSMALEKMVERMDWTVLTGSNGIAAIKMLLELEEKHGKRVQARSDVSQRGKPQGEDAAREDLHPEFSPRCSPSLSSETREDDASAAGETAQQVQSWWVEDAMNGFYHDRDLISKEEMAADYVPGAEASDAAETPESESSDNDNRQEDVTPAAKASDTAVVKVEDSVADEGSGGNFTPDVRVYKSRDVPAVEPEPEPAPIEV